MIQKYFFLLLVVVMHSLVIAEEFFIPEQFSDGRRIEQVILISDVDGVVRDSTEAIADQRIIHAVKSLLNNKGIDITFISGTQIANDRTLETWRRGNLPLSEVFGSSFAKELSEKQVTIFGVLGGHRMTEDGTLEIADEYSKEVAWELSKLLLQGFLKEVVAFGTLSQQEIANNLQAQLDCLAPKELASSNITASEFTPIVDQIREHLDPNFRLLNSGALIETYTSCPPWNTALSTEWLKNEMNKPQYLTSQLPLVNRQIATGVAKKGEYSYNYLLISKTNKGLTTKKHISEKIKTLPNALIITIGDTQVDFPMHQNAHLAFHVGLEKVLLNHPLPNCVMIRNSKGEDSQHVEGTLKVLALLEEAVGKSFDDFRYIPKQDSSGTWDYYSIRELQ